MQKFYYLYVVSTITLLSIPLPALSQDAMFQVIIQNKDYLSMEVVPSQVTLLTKIISTILSTITHNSNSFLFQKSLIPFSTFSPLSLPLITLPFTFPLKVILQLS